MRDHEHTLLNAMIDYTESVVAFMEGSTEIHFPDLVLENEL
jgi:hypothetical protein